VEPDFAIIYMVKDVPAADSTPLLIEAFERETDPEKRKFILTVLWYNLDERGFSFIDSLRPESITSTALRERVVEFQKRNRMAGSSGIFGGSFETINKKRLAVLDRLSDVTIETSQGKARLSYRRDAATVIFTYEFQQRGGLLRRDEYEGVRQILQKLQEAERRPIILRRRQEL
jgi:hypothetical protein